MTRSVALLLLATTFAACSLLTGFNPEGQPCDLSANAGSQCLSGFNCKNGKCVKDAGP